MTVAPDLGGPASPPRLTCVILAGGSGTRLWPRSRQRLPKHFLPLAPDGRSLLRHAYERAAGLGGEVLVVSAAEQGPQVVRELPELPPGHLLLEPEPRGTGPALAWAALEAERITPGAVMVSVHADHYIPDPAVFGALASAAWWAREAQLLVAVGLRPTWAAPGFGYIEAGDEWPRPAGLPGAVWPLRRAVRFVEKPDHELALFMVDSGRFLWNTGLFAWPAQLLLSELAMFAPAVLTAVRDALLKSSFVEFAKEWAQIPSGVVERLVLERSSRLGVLPSDLEWSDLGSFRDLHQVGGAAGLADSSGNVSSGAVLLDDCQGSFIDSTSGRLVVVIGGTDLAVVDTPDALLVCPLSRVQEVSRVVARLRSEGRSELL